MKIVGRWMSCAGLALLLAGSAVAGIKTWQVGSGNWSDGANWAGGVPVAGDDVVITNASANVLLAASTPELASLTLSGKLVCTNWGTALQAQSVTVASGGLITLPNAFSESQMSNRVWIVCSNLTMATNAIIDVTGKGYAGGPVGFDGYGPGAGKGSSTTSTRGGAAGYGGRGGRAMYASTGAWGLEGGTVYGSAATPEAPGSGGGAQGSANFGGGAGGGAVRIEASGDVVINGTINANGANALRYCGGGSGGGIWISCNRFGGTTGSLTANGGLGNDFGGSGGGGRIAIDYAELIGKPDVRFEVREAFGVLPIWHPLERDETFVFARYGTLWFPDTQLLSTTLTHFYGTFVIPGFTEWAPATLSVSNGLVGFEPNFQLQVAGSLTVGTGGALEMAPNGYLAAAGDMVIDGGRLVLNGFTQMVCQASMSVTNGGTFYAYGNPTNGTAAFGASVDVAGDIRVGNAAWIMPIANYTNGGPVRFRCANARIAPGSGFDANGRGFSGGMTVGEKGWGPGGGQRGVSTPKYGTGAGHGGQGGWGWYNNAWGLSGGSIYGNTNAPVMPGSGGGSYKNQYGGHGGGTVWIEVDGRLTLDGVIRANGILPTLYSGGGSGGGIFLVARAFGGAASGVLAADGSDLGERGSPGGGGRIAVVTGLDNAEREALIANGAVPGLLDYPPAAVFAGALSVGVGAGPDYTGETWREPGLGTVVFLKSGRGRGAVLMIR